MDDVAAGTEGEGQEPEVTSHREGLESAINEGNAADAAGAQSEQPGATAAPPAGQATPPADAPASQTRTLESVTAEFDAYKKGEQERINTAASALLRRIADENPALREAIYGPQAGAAPTTPQPPTGAKPVEDPVAKRLDEIDARTKGLVQERALRDAFDAAATELEKYKPVYEHAEFGEFAATEMSAYVRSMVLQGKQPDIAGAAKHFADKYGGKIQAFDKRIRDSYTTSKQTAAKIPPGAGKGGVPPGSAPRSFKVGSKEHRDGLAAAIDAAEAAE